MNELESITLTLGDTYTEEPYTESGFTTYVNGEVDTNTVGVYVITYTLIKTNPTFETETWTREVTVTSAPSQSGSIQLSGNSVVTVLLSDIASYVDAGAISSEGTVLVTNLDGTSSETFTGLPNVAGSYTLIYYLPGSLSNFVTRTIHVNDPNSGGGGGGGGGEVAPTTGPKSVVFEDISTSPTTGPKSVGLEVFITLPTTGPKTIVTKSIPAQSLPIIGTSTDGVSSNTPAQSLPIIGISTDGVSSNTPAQSLPIIGTSTDGVSSNTPAQSLPIIGTQA